MNSVYDLSGILIYSCLLKGLQDILFSELGYTVQGNKKIVHKGYTYCRHYFYAAGGTQYWVCTMAWKKKCKGRAITTPDNRIMTRKDHNHPPDHRANAKFDPFTEYY